MKPIIVSIGNQRIPAIHIQDNIAFTDKLVFIDNKHKVLTQVSYNPSKLATPVKKEYAITINDLIELGYEIEKNDDNFIYTNTGCKRYIKINSKYVGYTAVSIYEDGGTRTVFNGHVRSLEELKLILDLVL